MAVEGLPPWASAEVQRALSALGNGPDGQRKQRTVLRLANAPAPAVFGQDGCASFRQWYGGRDAAGHFRRGWCMDDRVKRALRVARRAVMEYVHDLSDVGGAAE